MQLHMQKQLQVLVILNVTTDYKALEWAYILLASYLTSSYCNLLVNNLGLYSSRPQIISSGCTPNTVINAAHTANTVLNAALG